MEENSNTTLKPPSQPTSHKEGTTGRSYARPDKENSASTSHSTSSLSGGGEGGYRRGGERSQYRPRTRLPFKKKFCFFTRNHITYIDYKDTLLLKRFLGRSGQILSPRITGVKPIYQRRLALAIKRARYMGLIPYVGEVVREDMPPPRYASSTSAPAEHKDAPNNSTSTPHYERRSRESYVEKPAPAPTAPVPAPTAPVPTAAADPAPPAAPTPSAPVVTPPSSPADTSLDHPEEHSKNSERSHKTTSAPANTSTPSRSPAPPPRSPKPASTTPAPHYEPPISAVDP